MKKGAILLSISFALSANFALGEPTGSTETSKDVTVALICDSEESCTHLAGIIKGSNDYEPITVALICNTEEECAHLSGIITREAPKKATQHEVLPLKILGKEKL